MSTILVNTLTGTSTAGSITVTGEGNSTTTNLQKGLAKAYINQDEGTSIIKSFNVASLVDNATGDYIVNLTNNMSDANYIPTSAAVPHDFTASSVSVLHGTRSGSGRDVDTDHFHQRTGKVSSSAVDSTSVRSTVHGDLA
jgi:hypothetical protein